MVSWNTREHYRNRPVIDYVITKNTYAQNRARFRGHGVNLVPSSRGRKYRIANVDGDVRVVVRDLVVINTTWLWSRQIQQHRAIFALCLFTRSLAVLIDAFFESWPGIGHCSAGLETIHAVEYRSFHVRYSWFVLFFYWKYVKRHVYIRRMYRSKKRIIGQTSSGTEIDRKAFETRTLPRAVGCGET